MACNGEHVCLVTARVAEVLFFDCKTYVVVPLAGARTPTLLMSAVALSVGSCIMSLTSPQLKALYTGPEKTFDELMEHYRQA